MSPEEELQRAARAEQILGDDLFQEACKEIERAILNGIKSSAIKDEELREKLCQQLILFEALVGQFRTHMETGKLAEATLRQRALAAAKKVVNW
jgi:hypothetical protein